ncbi:hypothetical protein LXL04_001733 [Taraxacum kok-saghyz]
MHINQFGPKTRMTDNIELALQEREVAEYEAEMKTVDMGVVYLQEQDEMDHPLYSGLDGVEFLLHQLYSPGVFWSTKQPVGFVLMQWNVSTTFLCIAFSPSLSSNRHGSGVHDRDLGIRCSMGTLSEKTKILLLIFCGMFWCIWKGRNDRVFNQEKKPPTLIVDNLQSHSFLWLKHRGSRKGINGLIGVHLL